MNTRLHGTLRHLGLTILSCGILACATQDAEPDGARSVARVTSKLQSEVGWHTHLTQIHAPHVGDETSPDAAAANFRIEAVNWYGFETRNAVAHGLWANDYTAILDQIQSAGFNTVRIPYSDEMWATNPIVRSSVISACAACAGRSSRDVLALILNYARSIGLHVILDNHRSSAGNSAESSGMWYTDAYPESDWIAHWVEIQEWLHGVGGHEDTIPIDYVPGEVPTVIGFDVRNEPHTGGKGKNASYLGGATWGTGDGIDPAQNPNPNPFAPSCTGDSSCNDWRLAAERAGTTILGEAYAHGWAYPLIIVEGIGQYPADNTSPEDGVTETGWWGGMLKGPKGNSTNPGAPVVLNAGQDPNSATGLGPAVDTQLVYSAHDYGPDLSGQAWFNAGTTATSLAAVWSDQWAYLSTGFSPSWPGTPQYPTYPWANTGHAGYSVAPVLVGEFGTGNADDQLCSTAPGSQGQWFTALLHFIANNNLHWGYWALNGNDDYALLNTDWDAVQNPAKLDTFLCAIQSGGCLQPDPDSCVGAAPVCESDVDCDDTNPCNGAETCDPELGCVAGTPTVCADDGDACTAQSCNPANGMCETTAVVCDDANDCTEDVCDSALGCTVTGVNLCPACQPNRAACSTSGDCCSGNCRGGTCKGN